MSSIASNLATLARSKLQSAYAGSGSRDNLSLHRWVLLKNSINTSDVHSDRAARNTMSISDSPDSPGGADSDADLEDEEVDSVIDEGVFNFLFPDPWDAVAPADEGSASEEQWFNSLLQSLGDDDDYEDADADVKMHIASADASGDAEQLDDHSRAESESLCASCSEEYATPTPSPISVPYTVPYSPFHTSLAHPYKIDSHDCCFASDSSPYSHFHHHDIDDSESSVPDAIEDTSDDESESVLTPFSRSRASLNLVDPASVPLPSDRFEPQIYRGSSDLFPYEEDPLPYSDMTSESPGVYSPYHQVC